MTTSFFPSANSEIGLDPIGARKAFSISREVSFFLSPPFMGQKKTFHEEGNDNSISVFPYQMCWGTLMAMIFSRVSETVIDTLFCGFLLHLCDQVNKGGG